MTDNEMREGVEIMAEASWKSRAKRIGSVVPDDVLDRAPREIWQTDIPGATSALRALLDQGWTVTSPKLGDTPESLRHQRGLLAEALGKMLVAYKVVRADAELTGPELLLAAETAIAAASAPLGAADER